MLRATLFSLLYFSCNLCFSQLCDTEQWMRIGLSDGLRIQTPGREQVVFFRSNTRNGTSYYIELSGISKTNTKVDKGVIIEFSDGTTMIKPKEKVDVSPHFDNENYKYKTYFGISPTDFEQFKAKQIAGFTLAGVATNQLDKETASRLNGYANCLSREEAKYIPIKVD